jgi:small subunit ribosomal protein S8
MTIDAIGDLLTRLRNAYLARIIEVRIPYSSAKAEVLKILKKNKYVVEVSENDLGNNKKELVVTLNDVRITKYMPSFIRISRPGQRIYVKSSEIKKSRNGKGIFLVSTPKGVLTGYEARSLNVGGELMCEVF